MDTFLRALLDAGLTAGLVLAGSAALLRYFAAAYLGERGRLRAQAEALPEIEHKLDEIHTASSGEKAYLSEKGKNLATKEDLQEITKAVESIRTENATVMELLKWDLSRRGTVHRLRAEKELEVLIEIWRTLAELRLAAENLYPLLERYDVTIPARERFEHKLGDFHKCYNNFLNSFYLNKPFYSNEMFATLMATLDKAKLLEINFRYGLGEKAEALSPTAYDKGREGLSDLLGLIEQVCDQIRRRPE